MMPPRLLHRSTSPSARYERGCVFRAGGKLTGAAAAATIATLAGAAIGLDGGRCRGGPCFFRCETWRDGCERCDPRGSGSD